MATFFGSRLGYHQPRQWIGFIKLGWRILILSYNVWSYLLLLSCAFTTSLCLSQFNASRLAPTPDGLVNGKFPPEIWLVFLHEVKIIHTSKGQKKGEIKFFYGKMTTLNWDSDYWHWRKGYHFFNYILKFGRESLYHQQDLKNYTCGGQMARLWSPGEL